MGIALTFPAAVDATDRALLHEGISSSSQACSLNNARSTDDSRAALSFTANVFGVMLLFFCCSLFVHHSELSGI